jgi:hypothetical protein
MPRPSAGKRVGESTSIIKQVLDQLDTREITSVSPALLPHVASKLYSRITYERYKCICVSESVSRRPMRTSWLLMRSDGNKPT